MSTIYHWNGDQTVMRRTKGGSLIPTITFWNGDADVTAYTPDGKPFTVREHHAERYGDITFRFTAEQARQAAMAIDLRDHRITLERIARDVDSIVTTEYGLFDTPAAPPRYTIPADWRWYQRLGSWLLLKWCGL